MEIEATAAREAAGAEAPSAVRPLEATPDRSVGASVTGLVAAGTLVLAWATILAVGFTRGVEGLGVVGAAVLVVLSVFVHTGLFITVHDALHGTVCPRWPRLNRLVGRVVARLYAGFSWGRLLERHIRHHRFPGTALDPDHHAPGSPGVVRWYVRFVGEYVTWGQLLWMAVAFNVLSHAVGVAEGRLLLFWVLPALLSTVQLFVFGTWLPHRTPEGGHDNAHHARSAAFPPWLSFVTCYHFGYHHEHHALPAVPWWRLPAARRRLAALQDTGG
ncbi:MAG: beta-carotene ketolase [Deltaproteobacteria bacterium]|nr:MAG: beta-carotene ketolase [Deltaproteobacteria bacterium]